MNGIWLRLTLCSGGDVIGFVPGIESPSDIWNHGKAQTVRVESARERNAAGKSVERDVVHVNRDRIELIEVFPEKP